VSREEIEEILEVAPFDIGDRRRIVDKLPSRETIIARRSIDDIRTELGRLDARLAEAVDQAISPADLEELRSELSDANERITAQSRETSALLNQRDVEFRDLQSSLDQAFSTWAELRNNIQGAIHDLAILKQQSVDLESRVGAAEERLVRLKEDAKSAISRVNESATVFPIKPSIRIIDQRDNEAVTIGATDQARKMAVALRNAGLAKQSAEEAAYVLSASLMASGWVNVSGSLATYMAASLAAVVYARQCLVSIPVGCLEQITKPPSEWTGTPTLWRILGFDRAPVQVTARALKTTVVNKLITRKGEHFVIALHEGGDICRSVLHDAAQLGAWIDTDALAWSGRLRRADAGSYNLASFAINESETDQEDFEHQVEPALGRLLEARFSGALSLFVADEGLKARLLERHIIAPFCAAEGGVDRIKMLTDARALQIAMRLRVS